MRHKKSTVGETQASHEAFNAIEAQVAILLDSMRAERDDKALLAFCERAAEDAAGAEVDRGAVAVALHDPVLNEAFDRVRCLLEAVRSVSSPN